MNIIITTLSIGANYTKDYTMRLIEDVLLLSDVNIYITTDCDEIILEKYEKNNRVIVNPIERKDYVISLPIGKIKGASDFNFNLRYLCLEHVQDLEDTLVIFTDCDNSFDWWDRNLVESFVKEHLQNNLDFFAPRTMYKLINGVNTFNQNYKSDKELNYADHTVIWHKFFNYDLFDEKTNGVPNIEVHPWKYSPIPTEYLVIMYNKEDKLKRMVDQWKLFYKTLNSKDYTYGTWAEGFEIGVSAHVAGFKDYDIGYCHPIWGKMFEPNGYKTGKKSLGIGHPTER